MCSTSLYAQATLDSLSPSCGVSKRNSPICKPKTTTTTTTRPTQKRKATHECPFLNCKRMYTTRFNLRRHVNLEHTQRKPFVCRLCHLSFGLKQYAKDHLLRHHGSEIGIGGKHGNDKLQSISLDDKLCDQFIIKHSSWSEYSDCKSEEELVGLLPQLVQQFDCERLLKSRQLEIPAKCTFF
mmetsp:Transcript_16140/g.18099  ORF Transcript_16140/g.18099 Transcript_16140/m.18099 type:complete len:182 (-) Transcript_16140:194-739(-)